MQGLWACIAHASIVLAAPSVLRGQEPGECPPIVRLSSIEPVLNEPDVLPAWSWEEYAATAKRLESFEGFVALGGSTGTTYAGGDFGLNVVVPFGTEGAMRNVSWCVIRKSAGVRTLLIDWDADGELSDESGISLVRRLGTDEWQGRAEHESERNGTTATTWAFRRTGGHSRLLAYPWRERRGWVERGTRRVALAVRTRATSFDSADALIGIDLDGDGVVTFAEWDREVFRVSESRVSLDADTECTLRVDPDGGRVQMKSTGSRPALRSALTVGTRAPLMERAEPLEIARDHVTMLDFWSPDCSGPEKMATRLASAKEANPGVQFISITASDEAKSTAFAAQHAHAWAHVAGERGDAADGAFRISSIPA